MCACYMSVYVAGSHEILVGEFQTSNQQFSLRTSLLRFPGETPSVGMTSGRDLVSGSSGPGPGLEGGGQWVELVGVT